MRQLWNEEANELLSVCDKTEDLVEVRERKDVTALALLTVECPNGRDIFEVLVVVDEENNWELIQEVIEDCRSSINNIRSFVGYVFNPMKAPRTLDWYFTK